ncbi:hypothetical protein Cni_G19518 [Canna indica]|uniref:Uncharacterized protein n=1 Tax=Canna indica TaxID=4628 RepID=A0AAQ3KMA7_9LILI|nr:hypothetical protein Cni_G19518 [Canna indica]
MSISGSPARTESRRHSLDVRALARRSGEECALFERGRFYEVYAARRNERLRMRKAEEVAVAEDPGVAVELARRRGSKKAEAARRAVVPEEFPVIRARNLRSPVSARSSKEMKTPCYGAAECYSGCGKRAGGSSVRRL